MFALRLFTLLLSFLNLYAFSASVREPVVRRCLEELPLRGISARLGSILKKLSVPDVVMTVVRIQASDSDARAMLLTRLRDMGMAVFGEPVDRGQGQYDIYGRVQKRMCRKLEFLSVEDRSEGHSGLISIDEADAKALVMTRAGDRKSMLLELLRVELAALKPEDLSTRLGNVGGVVHSFELLDLFHSSSPTYNGRRSASVTLHFWQEVAGVVRERASIVRVVYSEIREEVRLRSFEVSNADWWETQLDPVLRGEPLEVGAPESPEVRNTQTSRIANRATRSGVGSGVGRPPEIVFLTSSSRGAIYAVIQHRRVGGMVSLVRFSPGAEEPVWIYLNEDASTEMLLR